MVHRAKTLERDTAGRDSLSGSLDEVGDLEFLLHDHPVAAPAGVVVRPVLVSHLSPASNPKPDLPLLMMAASIEIGFTMPSHPLLPRHSPEKQQN